MQNVSEKINITDVELVAKVFQDQRYFAVIIDRYSEKLSRYIRRITSINEQDREDLLQNVFIKIYVNLAAFDQSLSFNAWTYRITHNEVIDFARKQKRIKEKGYIDTDDEILEWQDGGCKILDIIYQAEDQKKINKTFLQVTPKYREILYLRFIENYSYKDISDILQKSEANVTSMIYRARKEFKKHYE